MNNRSLPSVKNRNTQFSNSLNSKSSPKKKTVTPYSKKIKNQLSFPLSGFLENNTFASTRTISFQQKIVSKEDFTSMLELSEPKSFKESFLGQSLFDLSVSLRNMDDVLNQILNFRLNAPLKLYSYASLLELINAASLCPPDVILQLLNIGKVMVTKQNYCEPKYLKELIRITKYMISRDFYYDSYGINQDKPKRKLIKILEIFLAHVNLPPQGEAGQLQTVHIEKIMNRNKKLNDVKLQRALLKKKQKRNRMQPDRSSSTSREKRKGKKKHSKIKYDSTEIKEKVEIPIEDTQPVVDNPENENPQEEPPVENENDNSEIVGHFSNDSGDEIHSDKIINSCSSMSLEFDQNNEQHEEEEKVDDKTEKVDKKDAESETDLSYSFQDDLYARYRSQSTNSTHVHQEITTIVNDYLHSDNVSVNSWKSSLTGSITFHLDIHPTESVAISNTLAEEEEFPELEDSDTELTNIERFLNSTNTIYERREKGKRRMKLLSPEKQQKISEYAKLFGDWTTAYINSRLVWKVMKSEPEFDINLLLSQIPVSFGDFLIEALITFAQNDGMHVPDIVRPGLD